MDARVAATTGGSRACLCFGLWVTWHHTAACGAGYGLWGITLLLAVKVMVGGIALLPAVQVTNMDYGTSHCCFGHRLWDTGHRIAACGTGYGSRGIALLLLYRLRGIALLRYR